MSSIISIENEILLKAGFNSNMERPLMQPTNEIDLSNSGEVLPDNVINWDALNINIFEEGMDLQSADFITGNSGWRIRGDGIAEFQAITITGAITATSGDIGGWTIGETTLHSAGNEIVLDSDNKKIIVGSDSSIILDGGNKRIEVGTANKIFIDGENKRIQSDNYVSGAFGSGFHLSDNLLEVGNIACRGLIRTAAFQKDVVNVMGGNFAVLDGDVLDEDMTADDDSTLKIKGTTEFAIGDILRIKEVNGANVDDEWLEVLAGDDVVCDSCSESNFAHVAGSLCNGNPIKLGQSFTGDGNTLNSCKFYMYKAGSPTGNAVATLYAHDGTFGTDGKPTGSVLATSDNFDVSALQESITLETFNFTGANKVQLVNGTHYFICLEYSGGDSDNYIAAGFAEASAHEGNLAYYISSWEALSYDAVFYVYTDMATNLYNVSRDKAGDYGADANPAWKKGATVVNYKQSGDGGVYMTASENNAPYLSVFAHAGEPWTDLSTKLRIGNLNGYLGYNSDIYGMGIGSSAGADANLVFDPTNGIRLRQGVTDKIILDNDGNATFNGKVTIGSGSTGIANLGDAGDLAVLDVVEKAKLGTTIIDGGYLKTGFVDAGRIDTGTLQVSSSLVGVLVKKGGDITIEGDDSNPGRIEWRDPNNTTHNWEMFMSVGSSAEFFYILPNNLTYRDIWIGKYNSEGADNTIKSEQMIRNLFVKAGNTLTGGGNAEINFQVWNGANSGSGHWSTLQIGGNDSKAEVTINCDLDVDGDITCDGVYFSASGRCRLPVGTNLY